MKIEENNKIIYFKLNKNIPKDIFSIIQSFTENVEEYYFRIKNEMDEITENQQIPYEILSYENKCKMYFNINNIYYIYKCISHGWFHEDLPDMWYAR